MQTSTHPVGSFLTYRGTVYPWHCDHMGHMNVMWYTGKFDEASWNVLQELGLSPKYLRENRRGMVAVEQHIEYRRELRAGDLVSVHSTVFEISGKKICFRHEMFNEGTGELAAASTIVSVHIDSDARKGCALPASVLSHAAASVAARA